MAPAQDFPSIRALMESKERVTQTVTRICEMRENLATNKRKAKDKRRTRTNQVVVYVGRCQQGRHRNLILVHAAVAEDDDRDALSDGIAKGGTTFSSFQDIAGIKGNYIDTAWVFRRTGQPCNICGTAIARIKLGGRSTHFCPQCQA